MNEFSESSEKKALYQIVIDDIVKQIKSNDFSFEKPLCTEKSLMERYGVSRITAKRAITELEGRGILYRKRGVGSFVSRDIYSNTPPGGREHQLFAFVIPFDITKGGLIHTFQAANAILNNAGYGMSIYITDDSVASRGRAVLSRLLESGVSGLVYYPSTDNIHLEVLNRYVMQNKPVVVMDIGTTCPYLHSVTSDNYGGGKALTEYLLSLGHRSISYLSGFPPEERTTIRDRFGGFLAAMRQSGTPIDPQNVVTDLGIDYRIPAEAGDPRSTPLCRAVLRLMQNGVTAIETENDELAFYTIMACQELGFDVPGQVSVCGFDNSDLAHMTSGGFTTVAQDFAQIGASIAQLLLDSLEAPDPDGKKIVLPTELVIQASTAPPDEGRRPPDGR